MKKLICAMLALALVLGLCVISSFAEDTNLALDKYVEVEMDIVNGSDNPDMAGGFWSSEFLTDGEWPAFTNNGVVPLGWYSCSPDIDVDITLELDLDDVYNVSEIRLLPQKFIGGYTYPSTYEVSVSADGKTYEVIGGETGQHVGAYLFSSYTPSDPYRDECYVTCEAPVYTLSNKAVRYVLIHITQMGNDPGDGLHYSGFGEIEVYGDPNPVQKETPTPEVTEAPTEAPTEVPTEVPTEAPVENPTEEATEPAEQPTEAVEEPTEAPEEPTAEPATEAPEEPTKAPEEPTQAPEEPTAEPDEEPTKAPEEATSEPAEKPTEKPAKKGCGSFAAGTFAMVCLAGAALLIVRKKH